MSQEGKKGFGGGFFLLVLGAIFMMLTLQNLSEKKTNAVAFNYQVEHLVAVDQRASGYWYRSAYRQRVARHQSWSKGQEQ